jgi:hypothetical protein
MPLEKKEEAIYTADGDNGAIVRIPALFVNLQPRLVAYFEAFAASISPTPLRAADQKLIVSD